MLRSQKDRGPAASAGPTHSPTRLQTALPPARSDLSLSMKIPLLFSLALLAALLAGCDTFDHRSKEKAVLFASLTPEQREKLKHGVIEIGNTPDMVFIALGEPDEKLETTTPDGRETVWVYYSYHQEYEGNIRTGFHRLVVYDPVRKAYSVYFQPLYTDVYSEFAEENIRINFRDGKVIQIEQPKPPGVGQTGSR
jgi:hypothetical protein